MRPEETTTITNRLAPDKPEFRNSLMAAVAGIARTMRFADIKAAPKTPAREGKEGRKESGLEHFSFVF